MPVFDRYLKEKERFLESCTQCGLCAKGCPILSYTFPSDKQKANVVFFPGCNVYFQPEKILNALDIMEAIGHEYAFLPGLANCCGDNHLFFGHLKEGGRRAEQLVRAVSGSDTVCCGSGAVCWFPDSAAKIREVRLKEVARTGAERLVTVCHYCNQTFVAEEPRYDFQVINYVNLVAEAIGIHRDDKFKQYTLWGNLDRILEDAAAHIAESPFERDRIAEVLQSVFVK